MFPTVISVQFASTYTLHQNIQYLDIGRVRAMFCAAHNLNSVLSPSNSLTRSDSIIRQVLKAVAELEERQHLEDETKLIN